MAEDKREAILTRIKEVLDGLVEEGCSFRNKLEIPENKRPGAVLLDNDEMRDETKDTSGRGRPANGPQYIVMTPEIFILVEDTAKEVGTTLNQFRAKVLKAIVSDAALVSLCNEIRYEGFTTALATGRQMEGQGRLHFSFVYALRFTEL